MKCSFSRWILVNCVVLAAWAISSGSANAQSFGPELHNTMMPASGGMGGTSIAQPQDLLSAVNGNPATLRQFDGIRVTFGSGWADANIRFDQTAPLPLVGVTPFSSRSATPGSAVGNIGITHALDEMGMPVTLGLALTSAAGAGVDFRGVPESNGTSAELVILQFTGGAGVQLTDKLSVGSTISMGQSFFDAPFSGIGAMTPAYGLRGALGLSYQMSPATSLGLYYQTKENFNYQDAVLFPANSRAFDVRMDLPDNIGLGIANRSLMDGQLLIAADLLYKQWDNCDLFKGIYNDQWVVQVGTQYTTQNRTKLRAGYVWAENPIAQINSITIGGVTLPDGLPAANYLQAQLAAINQHRLSAGVGVTDVIPGLDFDTYAGFMFHASEQLGASTHVSVSSYYLGAGLTYRFRAKPSM